MDRFELIKRNTLEIVEEKELRELLNKKKITLILDSDQVGQKAARNVWATRLGIDRCWNVLLPEGEDINSFFMKYDKAAFEKCLAQASRFKVEGIMSLSDALSELYNQANGSDLEEKFPLPWDSVNDLIEGGFVRKRLIVIGGQAAVGKTSFAISAISPLTTAFSALAIKGFTLTIRVSSWTSGTTW